MTRYGLTSEIANFLGLLVLLQLAGLAGGLMYGDVGLVSYEQRLEQLFGCYGMFFLVFFMTWLLHATNNAIALMLN